ncbi:hypothetical protein OAO87_02090 [bacterium]|nr:hypothetical protein [bacterium]
MTSWWGVRWRPGDHLARLAFDGLAHVKKQAGKRGARLEDAWMHRPKDRHLSSE